MNEGFFKMKGLLFIINPINPDFHRNFIHIAHNPQQNIKIVFPMAYFTFFPNYVSNMKLKAKDNVIILILYCNNSLDKNKKTDIIMNIFKMV